MSEVPAQPREGGDTGPGAMLARARVERGLGVAEIAEHLKFAVRQIEALEADDYGRLPEATIVRGMIRGYVKLVGMDPAPFLKALEHCNIRARASVDLRTRSIPFPDGNRRATRFYAALSIIVLLAIAAVLYEWHFSTVPPPPVVRAPPTRPAPVAVPAPLVETDPVVPVAPATPVEISPADAAQANPGGGQRIQFEFQRESWVEVKDREGKILLSQLNPAGTRKQVEGEPPFSLIIGNAAGVRVTHRGAPVELKRFVKTDVARFTLE